MAIRVPGMPLCEHEPAQRGACVRADGYPVSSWALGRTKGIMSLKTSASRACHAPARPTMESPGRLNRNHRRSVIGPRRRSVPASAGEDDGCRSKSLESSQKSKSRDGAGYVCIFLSVSLDSSRWVVFFIPRWVFLRLWTDSVEAAPKWNPAEKQYRSLPWRPWRRGPAVARHPTESLSASSPRPFFWAPSFGCRSGRWQ